MSFSLGQLARTRQQMRRIAPILQVLVRHGFGHIVQAISQRRLLPFRLRRVRAGAEVSDFQTITAARRLAMALEDLGPTFVKLGQMLSTRADLLPESYLHEFRKLTEHVKPFSSAVARETVEKELGKPLEEIFREFGDGPVASGSIGQVHHAVLADGEAAVVKVKRPGIEKTILADLDLLAMLAAQLERIKELKPFRPVMIVEEFKRSLRRELDFLAEAALTAKIGESLADNERVRIPRVHWDLTTGDVLTLERVRGISLNNMAEIRGRGADMARLARDLIEVFLQQFLRTGLFHADPHPGNILVLDDGRIGLVDFGMTGRLDNEIRRNLATSFIALTSRDLDAIVDIYMEVGAVPEDADRDRLKADIHDVLDKYYGIPVAAIDFRACFADIMRAARTHGVIFPRDFVLLGKSFVTMVTMARELDPACDMAAVARPYARRLMADKINPKRLAHDALSQGWLLAQIVRQLPRDVRRLTRKLLAGNLHFRLSLEQFEGIQRELDKATNRLAFSIIVSAIVIGSSVVLHAHTQPYVEDILPGGLGEFFATNMPGVSALGLVGFLIAGVLGLLLTVAIWRSGRL